MTVYFPTRLIHRVPVEAGNQCPPKYINKSMEQVTGIASPPSSMTRVAAASAQASLPPTPPPARPPARRVLNHRPGSGRSSPQLVMVEDINHDAACRAERDKRSPRPADGTI